MKMKMKIMAAYLVAKAKTGEAWRRKRNIGMAKS
jgi:hypothetical protein